MTAKSWKLFWILYAVGSLTAVIWLPIGLGFAAGGLVSLAVYKIDERYVDSILETRTPGKGIPMHVFLGQVLMAAVLILAVKFPQVLNIFAAAVGILLLKITVYIETLTERRK